jgi:hypothetical protein
MVVAKLFMRIHPVIDKKVKLVLLGAGPELDIKGTA